MTREGAIIILTNTASLLCYFNPEHEKQFREAYEMAIKALEEQPIRCGDCKHRYVDGENVRFNVCDLNHNKVQNDDWFCADAERKEGEAE